MTTPALNVFVASELVPSLNVTVPVGVPAPSPEALTLAVNTTDCPNTVGFVEDVNVVAVPSWLTVCVKADEVFVLKLPSPLYTAVSEWADTENDALVKVATPPLNVLVANAVAPSLNVTVPVGVPVPGAVALTVAVIVTDCPNTEGLADDASAVELLALFTVCVNVEEVLVVKLVNF